MRIRILSVPVADQEKALNFYAGKLGFVKKHDIDMGGGNRWLTLLAPDDLEGPELLLEPAPKDFKPSRVFQEELYKSGIPWTQFEVDSLDAEYERLQAQGVHFTTKPTDMGGVKAAMFDDTCGNYIMITEKYEVA